MGDVLALFTPLVAGFSRFVGRLLGFVRSVALWGCLRALSLCGSRWLSAARLASVRVLGRLRLLSFSMGANGNKKGLHSRQALRGYLVLFEIFVDSLYKLGNERKKETKNHARTSKKQV